MTTIGLIHIREANPGDLESISDMVLRVFDKYVGSGYSSEGQALFHSYVQPDAIQKRLITGFSFVLVALDDKEIIGVIEVKNCNHISVLFVDERYHKKGIAKRLLSKAIEKANSLNSITEITVNSSPYAVDIYKRLGFLQMDDEIERDGIRHTPMKKALG